MIHIKFYIKCVKKIDYDSSYRKMNHSLLYIIAFYLGMACSTYPLMFNKYEYAIRSWSGAA